MRIAIVGSGLTGLSAAHVLGGDPRHVVTVFETRARFGAESVDHLARLGVALHRSAQVERLAVFATGVWLWVHGRPERFDAALVATSAAEARALLVRSGMARRVGSATLAERVYFAEDGRAQPALVRMAADHPSVRLPLAAPRERCGMRSLVRRARCLTAAHVEYLDLSGEVWPLEIPAVYIANQRWVLDDAVAPHLTIRSPRRPSSSVAAAASAGELEAGRSLAFVVGGGRAARPRGRPGGAGGQRPHRPDRCPARAPPAAGPRRHRRALLPGDLVDRRVDRRHVCPHPPSRTPRDGVGAVRFSPPRGQSRPHRETPASTPGPGRPG